MPFADHGNQDQLACCAAATDGLWDPASVLDHRPSPPASASSTLSSSSPLRAPAAGVAALAKNVHPPPAQPAAASPWPPPPGEEDAKDDWVHHLPPLDMSMGMGMAWGDPHHAAMPQADHQHPASQQDSTFLRWIIGGDDASASAMDHPGLDLDHMLPFPLHPADDAKPFRSPPPALLHHQQQPHTHAAFHGAASFPSSSLDTQQQQQRALKPKAETAGDDAAAVDQLAEAARLAEAGDGFGAREILARLNHRLPAAGTPLHRSAFYFKEALRVALDEAAPSSASAASTPVDVLLKLGAYKAFSEVSPVLQFAHFTCVQAVLDELAGAACIHVLDFDIGVGEQWASLMQELAQRRPAAAALKVTAVVSPASHHPLELQLIHENLSNFAADLGVPFQFTIFSLDAVDPTELLAVAGGDAIAVHLPVGSVHATAVPSVLHLVRRLGAKLVISVDRSCDRGGELPFATHLFQALQSCMFLLESLDAMGTDSDVASKIERFLIQPKIQSCVTRRHRAAAAGDKMLPWRTMFASAGFVPVQISNFAEAQADSLLKKVPVRGFRVEKRGGSLLLHWQRAELVSVSAWRC